MHIKAETAAYERNYNNRGKDPGAHLGSPGRRIRSRSTATWFVVDAEGVLGAVAVLLPLVRPQPEAAAACAVVGGEDPAAALTGKTGSGCGVVVGERIWLWRGRAPPPRAAASAVRERDTERGPEREREGKEIETTWEMRWRRYRSRRRGRWRRPWRSPPPPAGLPRRRSSGRAPRAPPRPHRLAGSVIWRTAAVGIGDVRVSGGETERGLAREGLKREGKNARVCGTWVFVWSRSRTMLRQYPCPLCGESLGMLGYFRQFMAKVLGRGGGRNLGCVFGALDGGHPAVEICFAGLIRG